MIYIEIKENSGCLWMKQGQKKEKDDKWAQANLFGVISMFLFLIVMMFIYIYELYINLLNSEFTIYCKSLILN